MDKYTSKLGTTVNAFTVIYKHMPTCDIYSDTILDVSTRHLRSALKRNIPKTYEIVTIQQCNPESGALAGELYDNDKIVSQIKSLFTVVPPERRQAILFTLMNQIF